MPLRRLIRIGCLSLVGLVLAVQACADEATLRDAIGLPAAVMFLNYGAPGMIVAVVRGPDAAIIGMGETANGSGVEPNGQTIVRIGSISKAFAGQLLASLVAEGKAGLADPAARFLPDISLPERDGRPITLLDLAAHTAGLPREAPGNAAPGGNPFARFTWANYVTYLKSARLAAAPGRAAEYSNVGYGILGEALAGAAGRPYGDALAAHVTRPLGLKDTVLRLSAEQRNRLMTGHDFDGAAMEPFEVPDAMAASGGLYSTAEDMGRFMRWHLDRADPPGDRTRVLDHAFYVPRDGLTAVIGFDESGRMDAIGLGWLAMMPDGPRPYLIQKSGGLQGFMSYVVMAPTRGVGVFVVANRFSFAGLAGLAAAANGLVAELAPR